MNRDLENISHLIEAYFSHSMSADEQVEFERLLDANPQAAALFEEEKAVRAILMEDEMIDVRAQMEKDLGKMAKAQKVKKSLAWAGGISLAVVASVLLFYNNDVVTENSLGEKKTDKIEQTDDLPVVTEKEPNTTQDFQKNKADEINAVEAVETKQPESEDGENITAETASDVDSLYKEQPKQEEKAEKEIESLKKETKIKNKKNAEQTKPVEEKPEIIDCSQFQPAVTVEANPTRYNGSTGEIVVNGTEDGWSFSIDQENDYQFSPRFTDLEKGTYVVTIKDENNCVFETKPVDVDMSLCKDASEYNRIFNLQNQDTWEIPIVEDFEYEVKIYNKMQQICFDSEISGTGIPEWDGKDLNGNLVKLGLYKAVITYENKQTCVATVTLIR